MPGWLNAQLYPFEKIGLEQGLPNLRVNDFIEDSRGLFWIATEGAGLVRYDGFDFKAFNDEEHPERLFINSIEEDKEGNLWLAYEGGILKFDGKKYQGYSLPKGAGGAIKIALSGNNELLVSTRRSQLFQLEKDSLRPVQLATGKINDIHFSDNDLYLATTEGVFLYKNQKLQQIGPPATSLALVEDNKMAALCNDSICIVSVEGGSRKLIEARASALSAFKDKIAIVTPSSFSVIDSTKAIRFTTENGLPDEQFKGCFIDRSGVIWLYSDKGLTKLESTALKYYSEPQFVDGQVFAVDFSDKGDLFAISSGGLYRANSSALALKMERDFNYGVTLDMAEYNGFLWLGTERGLIRYNGNEFTKINFPALSQNFIFSLHASNDGLWIGTGQGVFRYYRGKLYNESQLNDLPFSTVYSISQANDSSLWFATYTEGLFRYHRKKWRVFKEMHGVRLDSLRFNTFAAVNANEIFAANPTEGLYHLTEGETVHLTIGQMNFAEIRSMSVDEDGHLWAGTNKGILQIFHKDEMHEVQPLIFAKGFASVACMPNAISITDSQLAVGTASGLLLLERKEYSSKKALPRLFLTDARLSFGDESLAGFARDTLVFTEIPASLDLPYDKNFLSFNFSGLTGYQPEELVYRYRLQGQSPGWTLAGKRREAVFSELKPGKYLFEAEVKRSGEDWSPHRITYTFNIARPFWETWWFISLLALVLGTTSYLFVRDRVNRINQRLKLENALLEMERKALRLQMNPHFIFNALDSISSFIFKNDPKQAIRYLNNFAKLMRLTLESSMEPLHPVETEVSILKNYLELEKLRFKGKFDYRIEVDEEIDYDVGIPPMLIQPHVENAILHGLKPKETPGELNIRFILEDAFLICEIEDNGIGRKKSKEIKKKKDHRSMATAINRDRINLLKKAKSEKVDIRIIDKTLPNGEGAGTLVRIQLPAEEI